MLDVPECVKHIRLTESFRQIYALVSLARTVNFFWYTLYLRCSTPNSVAQTRIGWHVTFVYCSTTLISNSVCLQWSDIIEYLLKLLIQKQIGTLSTTLWTDSNQIEIKNRILCSRNWRGRSTIKLQDAYGNDFQSCTIFSWFDSGTRRRSDVVVESTIAVLTMALRKKDKQIDSELFSQEA